MATVLEPTSRADEVEQTLIQLDADYSAIYGPDLASWSRGVRGEFFELQRSRRTMDREMHPLHPRKSSASRRRRHAKQLAYRIGQIAPGAVTVLITPLWTDITGTGARHVVARALTADGRALKFQAGGSRQITALLQGAHPDANWSHPQSWRADTNTLTDRVSRKEAA